MNDTEPPTRYPDNYFDFIYSVSVFTHLPEEMQFRWLAELARITKRKGYLILSVHGANHFKKEAQFYVGKEVEQEYKNRGFYYRKEANPTSGLPDFYRVTWHLPHYVKERWSEFFDILDFAEDKIGGKLQAAVFCQAR